MQFTTKENIIEVNGFLQSIGIGIDKMSCNGIVDMDIFLMSNINSPS